MREDRSHWKYQTQSVSEQREIDECREKEAIWRVGLMEEFYRS